MRRPRPQQHAKRRHLALAALASVTLAGCYNGDELVERVRNQAIRTRLEEIELGSFRVTLPRNPETGDMTEVSLRVFAESQRYKLNEIEDELAAKAPLLEDRALETLRATEHAELIDPELKRLRTRLLEAINPLLAGEPLEAIGFYDVRFVRH